MSDVVNVGTWELVRGDDDTFPIVDVDDTGTGIDLIATWGTTWTAQARVSADAIPPVTLAVDVSGATTGTVVLSIDHTTSAALTEELYVFDVQVTGGAEGTKTPYRGTIRLIKDVTHG